ncbi:response regulator [Nocardioides pyridinolyticus]
MTVRVVVVDDNRLLRAGLVTVLNSDPEIDVVAEADDGPTGVAATLELAPDVVLMDVEMPGGDGITATRRIVASAAPARILVLTMFDTDEYVLGALRAGASGFLIKTTEPSGLIRAVHACAAGQSTIGPTVMERLVASLTPAPVTVPGITDLTERELEVLRVMATGCSNLEIAERLYLAETTVKTHVGRIFDKLQVRDRVQAVVLAHRAGLTD